nr:ribonuclease H-like domain-containing protein [Tanacetum cinerariifolium]
MNESDLNDIHVNESEVLDNVFDSVFDSRESDRDDNQESDIEDENVFKPKEVKKTVKPSFETIEFVNARNTTVENESKAEKPRKFSQSPRGNKRNWNGLMTQRLGDGFEFKKKLVLPFNQKSAAKTDNLNEKVSTARADNVTTDGPKAVKSSACWIWRPKGNLMDHISKDSGSYTLKRFNYVDPQGNFDSGCSRHKTRNKSYLIDYQEIDGGFIAFGGNAKRGKITGKGKIRTRKLDFEDVYFVKEIMFNLFSVSQICDKKNNVIFTDTEYVVLSPDFKLLDESQVLLKVPRNNNMYSFDLNNIVPWEDLNQLWRLVKETLSNRPPTSDKEIELWVELSRVHQVTSKDKEIFMLVEKDYPLRKGLALVMISYKLQVENYLQMENDLILKIYKIANSLR